MEDNDECEWEILEGNTPELHFLIISLIATFLMIYNITSQTSYNGPVTGSHYIPTTLSTTLFRTATFFVSHEPNLLSACQVEIMTALDIDQGLVGKKGSQTTLEMTWKCYTTITKAISMVGSIEWELGKRSVDSEIIAVYGGKSAYYEQLRILQHVNVYPEMVGWLERSQLEPAQVEDTDHLIKQVICSKTWRNGLHGSRRKESGRGKRRKLSNLVVRRGRKMMVMILALLFLTKEHIRSQ